MNRGFWRSLFGPVERQPGEPVSHIPPRPLPEAKPLEPLCKDCRFCDLGKESPTLPRCAHPTSRSVVDGSAGACWVNRSFACGKEGKFYEARRTHLIGDNRPRDAIAERRK